MTGGDPESVRVAVVIKTLAGRDPVHLSFVVNDLEAAVHRFDAVVGGGPWSGYLIDETWPGERIHRGQPADWCLRLAFNNTRPQYELIQPIRGPSVLSEWLEQRGEGLHHVLYGVDSIDAVEVEMRDAGHPLVLELHTFGVDLHARGVLFDTVDAIGCYIEVAVPGGQMPDPHFVL
jgi:hypothetical protein